MLFVDRPGDARTAEEVVESGLEVAVVEVEAHVANGFDILRVIKEGIAALLFDLLDDRHDRCIFHFEDYGFGFLGKDRRDQNGQGKA